MLPTRATTSLLVFCLGKLVACASHFPVDDYHKILTCLSPFVSVLVLFFMEIRLAHETWCWLDSSTCLTLMPAWSSHALHVLSLVCILFGKLQTYALCFPFSSCAHQPGRGGTPPAASRESRPTTHCLPAHATQAR